MSQKTNRSYLNKAQTQREYKYRLLRDLYPPYWDDGWNFKKGHPSDKYRSYKTWKHSRNKQWER